MAVLCGKLTACTCPILLVHDIWWEYNLSSSCHILQIFHRKYIKIQERRENIIMENKSIAVNFIKPFLQLKWRPKIHCLWKYFQFPMWHMCCIQYNKMNGVKCNRKMIESTAAIICLICVMEELKETLVIIIWYFSILLCSQTDSMAHD
jgi:hypothetical protein